MVFFPMNFVSGGRREADENFATIFALYLVLTLSYYEIYENPVYFLISLTYFLSYFIFSLLFLEDLICFFPKFLR